MEKILVDLPKFEDLKVGDELLIKPNLVEGELYGGTLLGGLEWYMDMYCGTYTVKKIDKRDESFQIEEIYELNLWYNLAMFSHKLELVENEWVVGVCDFESGARKTWNEKFSTSEEAFKEIESQCIGLGRDYTIVDEYTIVLDSCMYIVSKEKELNILNSFIENYLQVAKSSV